MERMLGLQIVFGFWVTDELQVEIRKFLAKAANPAAVKAAFISHTPDRTDVLRR